ncbi:MAG: hypothetical protein Q9M30_11160 [Mariprofundaceae bacterium]|nr:hypothetical protein [Mariprofundaceae bacterium]
MPAVFHHRVVLIVLLCLSACASIPDSPLVSGIGPYQDIKARLLVIEPQHRWQVMLDWHTELASRGHARLVHAASNWIIELRWQGSYITLRDNHSPDWRRVRLSELAERGIVIAPHALSEFLAGGIPADFRETRTHQWESRKDGKLIRVLWHQQSHRLEISDIRHGRRATLMILDEHYNPPEKPPHPPASSAMHP